MELSNGSGSRNPGKKSRFSRTVKRVTSAKRSSVKARQYSRSPKKCENCKLVYSCVNLKRHQKICGKTAPDEGKGTKCLVDDCDLYFYHKNKMFDHLEESHGYHMEKEYPGPFATMSDFYAWKEEVEKATYSAFTKHCGEAKGKYMYFICQFDGSGKPHNRLPVNKTNRRNKKGKTKTGFTCLSRICVNRESDGLIHVTFYKSHNHELTPDNLCYQPMFRSDKEAIEAKIQAGIPSEVIHRQLQLDADSIFPPMERKHTISLQSLLSRAQRVKTRQEEDSTSISSLVTELCSEIYNPVFFYKPLEGATVIGEHDASELSYMENVFVLGLQTKAQEEMMLMHASKVLCADATPGTNSFMYQLLNLVVCDENDEGYPVAHIVTNKLNMETVSCVLKSLVSKCPDLLECLNIIITDNSQVLRGALKNVFGETVLYFTCWQHLKRAWSQKLKTILDSEKAQEVFMSLQTILEERNLSTFNDLCQGFLQNYDDYPEVTDFFMSYLRRKEEWADAYRNIPYCDVELNTLLESFHDKLEMFYTGMQPTFKIAYCVILLLNTAADYATEREMNLVSTPLSLKNSKVNNRHAEGLIIPDDDVENLPQQNIWKVKSQSEENKSHLVTLVKPSCDQPEHCFSGCFEPECFGLCSHVYSCSCTDSVSPCKHMHKVHSLTTRAENCQNVAIAQAGDSKFSSSFCPTTSKPNILKAKFKHEIMDQISNLQNALKSEDVSLAFLRYTKANLNTSLALRPTVKHCTGKRIQLIAEEQNEPKKLLVGQVSQSFKVITRKTEAPVYSKDTVTQTNVKKVLFESSNSGASTEPSKNCLPRIVQICTLNKDTVIAQDSPAQKEPCLVFLKK